MRRIFLLLFVGFVGCIPYKPPQARVEPVQFVIEQNTQLIKTSDWGVQGDEWRAYWEEERETN